MKRQVNIGSGNSQSSNDDNTTQVQIGWGTVIIGIVTIPMILAFIGWVVNTIFP